MEVTHVLWKIAKRDRDLQHSKVTCLCGWSSGWQPTEQLAREAYGKHKFMSVKSLSIGSSLSQDNCAHEWKEVDSQFNSELFTDVVCAKCQMPGQLDEQTKEVFFPAT